MDAAKIEAISANHDQLRSTFMVTIEPVICKAYANGIITNEDFSECQGINSNGTRATKFIEILQKKPEKAWSWLLAFCKAQQWDWLAKRLLESENEARHRGATTARQCELLQSPAYKAADEPDHGSKISAAVNTTTSVPTYTISNAHTFTIESNSTRKVLDTSRPTVVLLDIRSTTNGKGTGFLAEINLKDIPERPGEPTKMFGLMTNNHVISYEMLQDSRGVAHVIIAKDVEYDILFKENINDPTKKRFIFTCPLLDCTFIEFTEKQRTELANITTNLYKSNSYLPLHDANMNFELEDKVLIVQHPQGGENSIGAGKILARWGVKIHYGGGTDKGSSGSPLFNTAGNVIGLHCANGNDNYKIATCASYILKAMAADYFHADEQKWPRALGKIDEKASRLLNSFKNCEIRDTDKDHPLIKVKSNTDEMWLYRAHYWWFWALTCPGEKSDFKTWCWNPASTEKCHDNKANGQKLCDNFVYFLEALWYLRAALTECRASQNCLD